MIVVKIKKGNYFIKILSLIFMLSFFFVFATFFQNVSLEDKIGNDCCDTKAEQYWNIGLFIAIIMGFYKFLDVGWEMFKTSWLPREDYNAKRN